MKRIALSIALTALAGCASGRATTRRLDRPNEHRMTVNIEMAPVIGQHGIMQAFNKAAAKAAWNACHGPNYTLSPDYSSGGAKGTATTRTYEMILVCR